METACLCLMLEFRIGGWELILIAAMILLLLGARSGKLKELVRGLRKGMEEFTKATGEVSGEIQSAIDQHQQGGAEHETLKQKFILELWVAQGFGVGWIPFAPGTFGSVIGVLCFLALLATGSIWVYGLGMIGGIALSVLLCGVAEKILDEKDPGSVVLDEIIAMPICFAGWLAIFYAHNGVLPAPEYFFSPKHWPFTLGVFIAFRFFDIVKPWPVRQSQSLPGGWGVTVDDVLAAMYVNVLLLLVVYMGGLAT